MTELEIKDKQGLLMEENNSILDKQVAEKRKLTDDERAKIATNQEEYDDLELRKQNLKRTNTSEHDVFIKRKYPEKKAEPRFSLLKAIRDQADSKQLDEETRNLNVIGRKEFAKSQITGTGHIIIPTFEERANILAQTATAGQEIVAEDKKAILPPLVDKLVFSQAGATFMTGLVGNVSIPTYAGTTVGWKAEVAAADDGGGAFAEVELSPKRLTAYIAVSKLFLAQDGVGAERLLLENIANAVARKLESTILGVADGSATQPQGMGYKITTGADTKANAVVPTRTTILGLETAVDVSNALQGNLAYITSGTGRGILKTLPKDSVLSHGYLIEPDGTMNGYPVLVTNGASNVAGDDDIGSLVVFGNWADLIIAQWGGYDITVDPYTLAATNQVKITINAYFDAKGLRGTAITDDPPESTTSPDQYAKAFASVAIKAS